MSYEYPNVSDDSFQIDLHHKKEYLDYQTYPDNIKNDISFFPENYALFPHQIFVKHFMSPTTPYRNLLLYHSTGSGKTCSTIQITEQYKDQIRKYRNKTYIITSETLKKVFQEELVKKSCTRGTYEGDKINSKFAEHRRYYEFITYAIFYNKLDSLDKKLNDPKRVYNEIQEEFSNRMIVVDEFQNYKSIPTEKSKKDDTLLLKKKRSVSFRNTFLKMLLLSNNSKLLLLSATPVVDGIEDLRFIINAFNALKMETEYRDGKIICYGDPIYINEKNSYFDDFRYEIEEQTFPTVSDFKKKFYQNNKLNTKAIEEALRGQISYIKKSFDIKVKYKDMIDGKEDGVIWKPFSDFSPFPYRIVTTNMSVVQKRALTELVKKKGHFEWQMISTIMSNEKFTSGEETDDYEDKQFQLSEMHGEDSDECIDGLLSISQKFGKLIKYIKLAEKRKEKVFISTDWVAWMLERPNLKDENGNIIKENGKPKKMNMRPFLKRLLEVNGYKEYTYEQFKQDQKDGEEINLDQNIKGYYIVVTGEKPDPKDKINFINKTYNRKRNKYGDIFRILIGTSTLNEGVTLKAVRQTHLLYINKSYSLETVIQIFGRAVRGDSHDQFKSKKHRYTRRYIHMHTYNDHDVDIQFRMNEFKNIQETFLKYHEPDSEEKTDDDDDEKKTKRELPDNLAILKMVDNIKETFDPKNIMKDKYDEDNEEEENIMDTFDYFFNYNYSFFKAHIEIDEDDDDEKTIEYKQHVQKEIPNKEVFDNLKKSLYETLIENYKSFIYYPYDLYSYLQAFVKYIRNKKILNIFIQIAVDCNLNKESNKVSKCIPNIEEVKEVDEDTYKHEHNVSKLEYIIASIKKMFEEKKYYKYDEVIDYFIKEKDEKQVNLPTYISQDEVPILVNLALKEMVPNETIDITIFPHKIIHKGEIGYISHKGNIVSFQNAIGIQYANMKHETLLKKEEYLTDIFTNIKYGIDKDVVYTSIEDYFNANKATLNFTDEMVKVGEIEEADTSDSEEVSD